MKEILKALLFGALVVGLAAALYVLYNVRLDQLGLNYTL